MCFEAALRLFLHVTWTKIRSSLNGLSFLTPFSKSDFELNSINTSSSLLFVWFGWKSRIMLNNRRAAAAGEGGGGRRVEIPTDEFRYDSITASCC